MASGKEQSLEQLEAARNSAKSDVTAKVNKLNELMAARESADAIQRVQFELEEVLRDFQTAHEAYHSQIKHQREREESSKYYDSLLELATELEREINSWLTQPNARRLLTDESVHILPDDSASNAGIRDTYYTWSAVSPSARSSASAKARSAAKKAALEAKAATLQKLHDLQIEELRLQQRKAELEIQGEIAEAEAERQIYAQAEAEGKLEAYHHRDDSDIVQQPPKQSQYLKSSSTPLEQGLANIHEPAIIPKHKPPYEPGETPPSVKLNPDAPEWHHQTTPIQHGMFADRTGSFKDDSLQRLVETQDRQNSALQQLIQQQQAGVMALTLPQPSMQVFSGDPLDYCDFVRAFEHLVERKTPSPSARLYYLVQYTSGPVQELMRSCLSMREQEGYAEAKRLLKARYGQRYKIAAAHVKRLIEGPSIKSEDGTALQQFSIQLTSCVNTLKEIGYLNKLDNPDNLKKIIDRLPYSFRLKWRDTVDRIIEREDRDVTVKDITEFVTAKARAATHPVFGKVVNERPLKPLVSKQTRRQASGFQLRPKENLHLLKRHRTTSLNVPCVAKGIGCPDAASFVDSLYWKDKTSSMKRSFAATAFLPATSFANAPRKASVRYRDVQESIRPFFTLRAVPLQKGRERATIQTPSRRPTSSLAMDTLSPTIHQALL